MNNLLEFLDRVEAFIGGFIDGAPDAGPTAKAAIYLQRDIERFRRSRQIIEHLKDEPSLCEIARRLHTQDNAATAEPIYTVQEKHRIYGVDSGYSDDHVWVDPNNETQECSEDTPGAVRVGYVDKWMFVTAFLTLEAARQYRDNNAHRHPGGVRIYVASAYRNPEMIRVRRFLKLLVADPATAKEDEVDRSTVAEARSDPRPPVPWEEAKKRLDLDKPDAS